MSDLVVGGQLGNYLIDAVVGRGGMSVVYRATHARLGMQVALKVLAPELSADDTFRERFLREAQAAAGIDHPNVIPIHDFGIHEESLYIVMRYVAGGDLRRMLEEGGPLDPDRTLSLLRPAALALDAAHAHDLVHRDFKPANILLQRSSSGEVEHVYLTDFGIAKSNVDSERLTRTGVSIGTVGYMAPEQLEGRPVSAQTDVYALTATFYECLTGRVPFQRELAEGLRPPFGEPTALARLRPELPDGVDAVMQKGLAYDPADRHTGCRELIDDCAAALAGGAPAPAAAAAVAPTALSGTANDAPAGGERAGGAAADELAAPHARPPAQEPSPAQRPAGGKGPSRRRPVVLIAGAGALVVAAVVAVLALGSSGSNNEAGARSSTALGQVPTNHVAGSGSASIKLVGDRATVVVRTTGLDRGDALPHLMHIHAGGRGECPPASAARPHNGHLTISTTDGIIYYGPPAVALTTRGDTSVASILAFPRFETGGTLRYERTITLPSKVAAEMRAGDAVVIVHGIDYDNSGIYSGVLDRSELDKQVPGTATAPALCGKLAAVQTASAATAGRAAGYTASLALTPAIAAIPAQSLICHPPAGAVTGERRRVGSASA